MSKKVNLSKTFHLNIYHDSTKFPSDYEDYYPKNSAKVYNIYKDKDIYFIHATSAPYAITLKLGNKGDILMPRHSKENGAFTNIARIENNLKKLSSFKHITVNAYNSFAPNRKNKKLFALSAERLESFTPKKIKIEIEIVNNMLEFLKDKKRLIEFQVQQKGIKYSKIKEVITNYSENKSRNDYDDNEKILFYNLFLETPLSNKDKEKFKRWVKSSGRHSVTLYNSKEIDSNILEIVCDHYNEKNNCLVIKRYPGKEKLGRNKAIIPKSGYLSESINIDIILLNRQVQNCESFRDHKFILKEPFLNIETIKNVTHPTTAKWHHENLTIDQQKAVLTSLGTSPIVLVNGPPGTGKTTVILEIIYQLVLENKSVWVSSQTNLAIDNVLDRLYKDERIKPERRGGAEKIKNNLFYENPCADYIEIQYLEKLENFVIQYEKDKEILDDLQIKSDEYKSSEIDRNELQTTIKKIKTSINSLQAYAFLEWLDEPTRDLENVRNSVLKQLCNKLNEYCPFLPDTIGQYFWKQPIKVIITDLKHYIEELNRKLYHKEIDSSAFENFKSKLINLYPKEDSNSLDLVTLLKQKKEKEINLAKFNSINTIEKALEKEIYLASNKKKYQFYKELLNLESDTLKNSETNKDKSIRSQTYSKLQDSYLPNLIGATCNSKPYYLQIKSNKKLNLPLEEYDVVIVDEVSKLTTVEMFILVMLGKKLILIGDHHQLPPVFKEGRDLQYLESIIEESALDFDQFKERFRVYEQFLTQSKFEQMWKEITPEAKVSLTTQFRCHPDIMNIFNIFYKNDPEIRGLICGIHPDKRKHLFKTPWNPNMKNVVWIDSSSEKSEEKEIKPNNSTSTKNDYEVNIIEQALDDLYQEAERNELKKEVGVISLYGAQVKSLKDKLQKNISKYSEWLDVEINTVDDFQGKEKDITLVSMVRNPFYKESLRNNPFIKEYRRINVAMSRAKELLVIVGAIDVFLPVVINLNDKPVHVYRAILEDNREKMSIINGAEVLKNKGSNNDIA